MTIAGTNSRNNYVAGGVSCSFAYTFKISDDTNITVYLCGVLVTTGYTVSGAGTDSGGTVTFTTTPASGASVILMRNEPYTQTMDLQEHGVVSLEALEDTLDHGIMLDQQLLEKVDRSLQFAITSCLSGITVDTVTGQAGKILAVNTNETSLGWVHQNCSTTAATGTFMASGSGAASRTISSKLGDVVSVKDFGAVGNGVADDTTAIQNAINAAAGRTLYVPAGTYIVTSTLTYTTAATSGGLTIIGDGARKTIFDNQVASGAMISMDGGATSVFQHYGRLAEFRITTTTSPATSHGILMRAVWGLRIERVWIDSLTGDAIRIAQTSGDPDSVAHLMVTSCRLETNTGYGINDASSAGIATFAHLTIDNCYIRANTAGGVRWSGLGLDMTSSTVAQNGGSDGGVYIRYNTVGPGTGVIRTSEFDSNSTQHIKIDAGNVYRIENNMFTFQNVSPPGSFGPTTGIAIGDGTNTLNNVYVVGSRIRSNPTNPSSATTMYVITGATTADTRIEENAWLAFSGANATRYSDSGTRTLTRDEGVTCGASFVAPKVYAVSGMPATCTVYDQSLAKAWVVFDGSNTNPIVPSCSFNIAGTGGTSANPIVTKTATGQYCVKFVRAFACNRYGVSGTAAQSASQNVAVCPRPDEMNTTCVRFETLIGSGGLVDATYVFVEFKGTQA